MMRVASAGELGLLLRRRRSSRTAFDPARPVSRRIVRHLLEAARWSPTAHNMQNFHVLLVDDPRLLDALGDLPTRASRTFLRENLAQLSHSVVQLRQRGTGILARQFPQEWLDAGRVRHAGSRPDARPLRESLQGAPLLLFVLRDRRRRAPASAHDELGAISLGCLLQSLWLAAEAEGLAVQVLSAVATSPLQRRERALLGIPPQLAIVFALRLGYPRCESAGAPRVRRRIADFAHANRFGRPWR